jgi:rhodanese-related sulfurtransferase
MLDLLKNLLKKDYQNLDGKAFRSLYEQEKANAVLIDVRTSDEFRAGTLPGAINMDIMNAGFRQWAGELDATKEYFVFCRSGARSASACSIMASKGLRAVNLMGGLSAWPR